MAKLTISEPIEINIIPKFTISGSTKDLLKNLEQLSNVVTDQFVGLPIHDENGKKIGTITHIQGDFWYGEVDDQQEFLKQLTTSMELSVSHNKPFV